MIGEYGKSTVRPKKILRKVLLGLITVLVLLIIIKSAAGSGSLVLFPISSVQIFGTAYVSKREVLELIGLDAHKSILAFNKARAKSSLLRDARVAGVEIVKLFPDTLRIYVVEKEKKMLLKVENLKVEDLKVENLKVGGLKVGSAATAGTAYWLSTDGVVLAAVAETPVSADARPFITLGSNNDDIKVGGRTGNYLLESALKALGGIESRYPSFYRLIESVSIERDGVYVRLDDKRYVIYLGVSVTEEKLEQLRALLFVLKYQEPAGKGSGGDRGATGIGGPTGAGTIEIDMSFSQAAIKKRE